MTGARAVPLAVVAAIVLAGCGGDDGGTVSSSSSSASSAATPTATETTTKAPTGTIPTTPTTPTTEAGAKEPDAGDEEAIRVPASFKLKGGKLSPATVAVPAFLRIELVVANGDTGSHTVRFQGKTLGIPGGDTKSTVVEEGLKKGRYPVTVDGRAAGAVLSGAEGGP